MKAAIVILTFPLVWPSVILYWLLVDVIARGLEIFVDWWDRADKSMRQEEK